MNGSLGKEEQVGNLPSTSVYFRVRLLPGAQDAPVSFPITSKMDNGVTRYLRLFSIRKLSNYCSLSWGSQEAQREASGALKALNKLPEILQNLAAKLLLLPLAQRH